jgi:hypothetical protein
MDLPTLGRPTIATKGFAIGITPFTLKEHFIYYGTFFLLNQENTAEYLSIEKNYSARDFFADRPLKADDVSCIPRSFQKQ